MSTNEITGARLVSKVPNEAYKEGYDRIFSKKSPCSCHGCECGVEQDDTTLFSTKKDTSEEAKEKA